MFTKTRTKEVKKTLLSPNCFARYDPLTGPRQNDRPNVAKARPNAGALFFLSSTQSEMYAKVKGKVALIVLKRYEEYMDVEEG